MKEKAVGMKLRIARNYNLFPSPRGTVRYEYENEQQSLRR